MEPITDTVWDVLIADTGLGSSLLALALSRSDKKVLHIDANEYYGGSEAALSIKDAEAWVKRVKQDKSSSAVFGNPILQKPTPVKEDDRDAGPSVVSDAASRPQLGFPQAYNLALAPQIIYMRSAFHATLLSSRIFRQLDFMAVGSWFLYEAGPSAETGSEPKQPSLRKIPNSREDVFANKSMAIKEKRALISFQRLFRNSDEQAQVLQEHGDEPLGPFLSQKYGFSESLQQTVNALTLSPDPPSKTVVRYALPRIARHVTSMGVAGVGFGAVIPKWGGLAEIAQVACRAQAVGGGVYMLGQGIVSRSSVSDGVQNIVLDSETNVQVRKVAGTRAELRSSSPAETSTEHTSALRAIYVVAHTFDDLFTPLVEDGPRPAVAVVCFPGVSGSNGSANNPAYLMVHSAESGECPRGQCVIYASTLACGASGSDHKTLRDALDNLLAIEGKTSDCVLWSLAYSRATANATAAAAAESKTRGDQIASQADADAGAASTLYLSEMSTDLVFDDAILQDVRAAWQHVTGQEEEEGFMDFEDREAGSFDDDEVDSVHDF